MPEEKTEPESVHGTVGWIETEDRFRACNQVTCLNLARRLCLDLSVQLANCWTEMFTESGPYVRGARTHAQNLNGVISETRRLLREKLKFRRFTGAPAELNSILTAAIPNILRGLDDGVYRPLRELTQDEATAAAKIKNLCDVVGMFSTEAAECARNVNAMLEAHFGKMVAASLREQEPVCEERSVVSVDLCEYGRLAAVIEEIATVQQLQLFDKQIRDMLQKCVSASGIPPDQVVSKDGGDGATFLLNSTESAVTFSENVMSAVRAKNERTATDAHRWFFRIGISTGSTCRVETHAPDGTIIAVRASGLAIARAIRLQAAAEPNGILIGAGTWSRLAPELQQRFGSEEEIRAKPHERTLRGHRWIGLSGR